MNTKDQVSEVMQAPSRGEETHSRFSRRRFLFELGVKSATVLAAGHVMGCGGGDDDDMIGTSPTPSGATPTPSGETPTPRRETPTPSGDTPTPWGETPTPSGDTPTPWDTPTPAMTPTPEVVFENAIVGEVEDGVGEDYSPTTGAAREAIPSACWQCVSRDGIICYVEDGRLMHIEGNPKLLRTSGKLCSRGQGGVGQVYDPDRLLFPMKRVAGTARGAHQWERVTWDGAMSELTEKLAAARAADPKYLFFHYGRMKASSSKIAKSYFLSAFGSKSYAGHTAICEAAKWTGQELVWGKHYDVNDVSNSNVILNFGSNPLVAHTSHIPIAQRIVRSITEEGVPLYTFDPRLSNTAARSTEWIPTAPGTDLAVVLAMAYHIITNDLMPQAGKDFINQWTNIDATGHADRVARLKDLLEHPDVYIIAARSADPELIAYWDAGDQPSGGYTPEWAESMSGVPADKIREVSTIYAAGSPGSTIISYRGAVMHFNGVMTERAIQMLEGMCGNIDTVGGRVHGVGAAWSYSTAFPKPSGSTSGLSLQNDGAYVAPTHHASHQVLSQIRDAAPEDRPMVYMVYCYAPAYANGDIQENIDILKDESLIPYLVVSDTSYSEAAMYADLLLPDTTYLERWDYEDMVSYDMIPEWYIRQPAVAPLGEARNLQDVLIDLAVRLSSGPSDELEKVAAIGSMENFVKEACNNTSAVNAAGVAKGYANGFEFMKAEGAYYDPGATPTYEAYKSTVSLTLTDPTTIDDADSADYIFKDVEGICWEGTKAEYNAGYRATKSAYEHYKGQAIDDSGTIYAGFKPDMLNKSGFFELESPILAAQHYPSLPVWMKIPEHEDLAVDELLLSTYKIPTQTHSRTQNCKYLTEITHHEPVWINAQTASTLGIADGDEVRLTRTRDLYNDKGLSAKVGTAVSEMTVEVRITEAIHPKVVAISHHLGHWAYGRYASGTPHPMSSDPDMEAHSSEDPDTTEQWWSKYGYRPNWLMPNAGDPIGGALRFFDSVVRVERA